MTYTEDEAKTKRCPLMRQNCIASGCMMWRWDVSPDDAERSQSDPEKYQPFEADGFCAYRRRAMTDPVRENWPRLIAELEQAGISRWKLGQMLKPPCQLVSVKRWASRELWENGTEPAHSLGEQIRAIHAAYAVPRETAALKS